MVPSIFISHASRDAAEALCLAEDLKRAGLEVWLDEREIGVGKRPLRSLRFIRRGLSGFSLAVTRALNVARLFAAVQ